MIRNSIHALKKTAGKVPVATIGALAVFTLTFSTVHAATPSVSQADELAAEQVYNALNADPAYFFRHVDVQVQHGIVTLGGYVWSTQAVYRAEQIAARVPGVTRVIDQMELERDGVAPHA
jgi:BON domain